MSKQQPEFNNTEDEQVLAHLYQQRKRQHKAPNEQQAILMARLEQLSRGPKYVKWPNVRYYTSIAASVFAIALMVIVFSLPNSQHSVQKYSQSFVSVELHVLEDENFSPRQYASNNNYREVLYNQAKQDYLASQQQQLTRRLVYAKVLDSDTGLALLTCNNELLQISHSVVDKVLVNRNKSPITFSQGQVFELTLNNQGNIIDIEAKRTDKICS